MILVLTIVIALLIVILLVIGPVIVPALLWRLPRMPIDHPYACDHAHNY